MEESRELPVLPEEDEEKSEQPPSTLPLPPPPSESAFSSIPERPPVEVPDTKYAPIEWSTYFDKEEDIAITKSEEVFHVYTAGSKGPVVFCIHGGGYSGLSFAVAASKMKENARIVAMDLRGHGKSYAVNESDLSIETLCEDVVDVLKELYGDSPPAIVLVGHRFLPVAITLGLSPEERPYYAKVMTFSKQSMGGSVAVHLAASKLIPSLAGLIVVDVVEGTAMGSLMHMQKILSNRPRHFSSIRKAIEWSIKGGSLRNMESARVSVPSTLKYMDSKKCYLYRTPLEQSEIYWKGWYEGLSDKFLSSPVPKLLLLAGTDRLDRSLTIGQMQGKFQMVVVKHTGHAIQEDVPDEFASLVLHFISRNRIGPHGVEIPGIGRTSKPLV